MRPVRVFSRAISLEFRIAIFRTEITRLFHLGALTTSELRVELMFPADDSSDAFFQKLARQTGGSARSP